MHDRRGDVGHAVGDAVVAPQRRAAGRGNADHAVADKLHVLPDAGAVADDDRRVAGAVVAAVLHFGRGGGLPNHFAGRFVQRDDQRIVGARCADHDVAVNQRRLAVSPIRNLAAEVVNKTFLPHDAAGRGFGAHECAVVGDCENTVAINGGRTVGITVRLDRRGPNLFAVFGAESDQADAFFRALAEGEDSPAGHCDAGHAAT